MANVGTNRCVAIAWIAQSQRAMRSHNGNMSFLGTHVMSWSTCIAKLYPNMMEGPIVLLTKDRYSQTTEGKHKNEVWRACQKAGIPVIRVPHVDVTISAQTHHENEEYFLFHYREALNVIATKKPHIGLDQHEVDAPHNWLHALSQYCRAYGRPIPATDYEADYSLALLERANKIEIYNHPRNVEKRLRAKAKRDLLKLVNS